MKATTDIEVATGKFGYLDGGMVKAENKFHKLSAGQPGNIQMLELHLQGIQRQRGSLDAID